jgi:hypothetical protein
MNLDDLFVELVGGPGSGSGHSDAAQRKGAKIDA